MGPGAEGILLQGKNEILTTPALSISRNLIDLLEERHGPEAVSDAMSVPSYLGHIITSSPWVIYERPVGALGSYLQKEGGGPSTTIRYTLPESRSVTLPAPPADATTYLRISKRDMEGLRKRYLSSYSVGELTLPGSIVPITWWYGMRTSPRDLLPVWTTVRDTLANALFQVEADPLWFALATYSGADILDVSSTVLQGRTGAIPGPDGWQTFSGKGLVPGPGTRLRREDIHSNTMENAGSGTGSCDSSLIILRRCIEELATVRSMLSSGRLRELVERRSPGSPDSISYLRALDRDHMAWVQSRFDRSPPAPVNILGAISDSRPDIQGYLEALRSDYTPPEGARVILLLPCSARKPYSLSKSHARFREGLSRTEAYHSGYVNEVVLTSPMYVCPRELELVHPIQSYDIAVTGHWEDRERSGLEDTFRAFMETCGEVNGPLPVVIHFRKDAPECQVAVKVLLDMGIEHHVSVPGDSGERSDAALDRMAELVERLAADDQEGTNGAVGGQGGRGGPRSKHSPMKRYRFRSSDVRSLFRFQFGVPLDVPVSEISVKGRFPEIRIFIRDTAFAALSEPRGIMALAPEGYELLGGLGINRVDIEDFDVRGDIFVQGIKHADPGIRPGDEVVVFNGDRLVAGGVAMVCGKDMVHMTRGRGVKVRHQI